MLQIQEETKERIIQLVRSAGNQRVRPHDLEKSLSQERGITLSEFRLALKDLMQEGKLVFTYRDPCSFIEIPAS